MNRCSLCGQKGILCCDRYLQQLLWSCGLPVTVNELVCLTEYNLCPDGGVGQLWCDRKNKS